MALIDTAADMQVLCPSVEFPSIFNVLLFTNVKIPSPFQARVIGSTIKHVIGVSLKGSLWLL